jgi:uncharacterized protein YdbL (DUF1318 family)
MEVHRPFAPGGTTMLRRLLYPSLLTVLIIVAACVTINVYFPEAAAERAADRIIDEVWGTPPPQDEESDRTQRREPEEAVEDGLGIGVIGGDALLLAATRVLNAVVPAAHAQADLDIDTPQIRALTEAMNQRFRQLRPYYASGAIGLTRDAMIEIRDRNAVPLAQRGQLSQLVASENADRDALYAAIAVANGHPEWEGDIRATFAERWIARAGSGWYFRTASGAWQQK